jgi:hypothetical protein
MSTIDVDNQKTPSTPVHVTTLQPTPNPALAQTLGASVIAYHSHLPFWATSPQTSSKLSDFAGPHPLFMNANLSL